MPLEDRVLEKCLTAIPNRKDYCHERGFLLLYRAVENGLQSVSLQVHKPVFVILTGLDLNPKQKPRRISVQIFAIFKINKPNGQVVPFLVLDMCLYYISLSFMIIKILEFGLKITFEKPCSSHLMSQNKAFALL